MFDFAKKWLVSSNLFTFLKAWVQNHHLGSISTSPKKSARQFFSPCRTHFGPILSNNAATLSNVRGHSINTVTVGSNVKKSSSVSRAAKVKIICRTHYETVDITYTTCITDMTLMTVDNGYELITWITDMELITCITDMELIKNC